MRATGIPSRLMRSLISVGVRSVRSYVMSKSDQSVPHLVYTQKFICYTVNQRPETSDTVPTVVLAQLYGGPSGGGLFGGGGEMAGAVMVGAVMAHATDEASVTAIPGHLDPTSSP